MQVLLNKIHVVFNNEINTNTLILMGLGSVGLYLLALFAARTSKQLVINKVAYVYDGDTFYIHQTQIPKSTIRRLRLKVNNKGNVGVRLANVDTPEIKGGSNKDRELAQKAKMFTRELVESSSHIKLKNMKRDYYGRLLAEVYINNKNLSKLLLKNNLAKPITKQFKRSY